MRRELWLIPQHAQKLLARDNEKFCAHDCSRGRGPGLTIEERNLPEGLPWSHDVEKHFLAARTAHADAHPSAHHSAQRVAGIPAHEDNRALIVDPAHGQSGDTFVNRTCEAAKQAVALDDGFGCESYGPTLSAEGKGSTLEYSPGILSVAAAMSSSRARDSWWLLLLCLLLSSPGRAQYEVETQQSVWVRALLDVRVVGGGPAPSWTDHGPGKMRYGGSNTPTGFERSTQLVLSQAALQLGASLPWGVRAQLQTNIEPDVADGYHPWLVEAILRREWGNGERGWGAQAGLANLPFSLENTGPAWMPGYTISASALNSWFWEDISLAGMEGEWWHTTMSGMRLGALVGAGYGRDQIGRLLALRGFALGDVIGGANGTLAVPTGRTDIFVEHD